MSKIDIAPLFDWEKGSHTTESDSKTSTDESTDSSSDSSRFSKANLFLKSVRAHRPTFE